MAEVEYNKIMLAPKIVTATKCKGGAAFIDALNIKAINATTDKIAPAKCDNELKGSRI
jgi:hypothetical protein